MVVGLSFGDFSPIEFGANFVSDDGARNSRNSETGERNSSTKGSESHSSDQCRATDGSSYAAQGRQA